MTIIRLAVVEDDPVWMKCLCEYVEKEHDMTVIQKAATKEEALQINIEDIDVILLDLTLSDSNDDENLNGLQVANHLNNIGLKNIIMLTSWEEQEIILEAFDSGAINYLTKSSYRDIPGTIRDAYKGKVSIHSDVSSTLVNALKTERKISVLTPSEKEVYKLKEKGLNKNQIADLLYKSVETIKKQFKMINNKIK
ncbi:response regulator transcription factor [Bacillus thuringiensis]|uniref:response regulator transcription factor n=1 Tax=Bacillus cereus group TaxID=86661 RepID=UPI001F0ECCD2|nr:MULTISPECIES: response regulator transcription factor [Bacillus cereus group]MCH5460818.1 response regulator transcription factor [Bacillus cereus]MEC3227397.1 response regulator transcription factor [Bacillus thuringiensis]MED2071781.1 response regulator transcription factor [Bacillus thuringiensis]MED2192965.1 response regulator transcription factor [Bacillus thuringiensis]MED2223600.1 response regulator transcription factor [Bacillus thuringiensis]